MPQQLVLVVHGMGKHPKDSWFNPVGSLLRDTFRQYEPFRSLTEIAFDRLVHFAPISYDAVIEDGYRKQWSDLANALSHPDLAVSSDIRQAIEATLDSSNSDTGLQQYFWDNLLDVLLWQFLPQARDAIIAHVDGEVGTAIKEWNMKNAEDPGGFPHVLAHSLGTSVATDSLVSFRSWKDPAGVLDPRNFRWRSVTMLANVSRLLQATISPSTTIGLSSYAVYDRGLRPGQPWSLCEFFTSCRNEWDPITWPKRFDPNKQTEAYWPEKTYVENVTDRYSSLRRIHDFESYIADPRVHVPLIRRVMSDESLCTLSELGGAWSKYSATFSHSESFSSASLSGILGTDPDRDLGVAELVQYLCESFKVFRA
jgi:hypothetical protein